MTGPSSDLLLSLHFLTVKDGEVYLHHEWLLFFVALAIAGAASR